MTGEWKSQLFAAEGSTTASGILRQLGRPSLDEFTILVREAAQNSWDARVGDADVDFSIRLERVGHRASSWRSLLLPGPPAESVPGFDSVLSFDSWILIVSDRGTQGLGGPIRATERPAPDEKNDFVQFLRNVGEPRDTSLGGGTYGFGKGIFYRTSTIRTIIADSRIRQDGAFQRRLMGAALGHDFWDDREDVRYTGRHWWGRSANGVIDPLLGDDAELVASSLELPGFDPDQTGTNIVVLGVDLDLIGESGETGSTGPVALGAHLASAMLWNLWPKFRAVSSSQLPAMNFSVIVDGVPIEVPSPAQVLALRPFVESYQVLTAGEGKPYRRTGQPRIHVGDFVASVGVAPQSETSVTESARPFVGAPHHVARMRQADLVVDYLEGPEHPDPLLAYGGVFRATAEADGHFAESEPPTHDRWNSEGLEKESKAVVEGAQRWLREELNRRFQVATPSHSGSATSGLGRGSRRLSRLVAGLRATGADPVSHGPTGPEQARTGTSERSAYLVGEPWIADYEQSVGVFARVRVPDPQTVASLKAHLDVVLDGGGREETAPTGVFTPQPLEWFAEFDHTIRQQGAMLTDLRDVQDWIVVAQFSDSAVTRLRLEAKTTDGA